MIEFLLERALVNMIDEEKLPSDYPKKELLELIKINGKAKSSSINQLDIEKKRLIDHLIGSYGILNTLKRLITIRKSISTITSELRSKDDELELLADLNLLDLAACSLYCDIEKYYIPAVYLNIYTHCQKLAKGNFIVKDFLASVLEESPSTKVALASYLYPEEQAQEHFDDMVDRSSSQVLVSIGHSYLTRENIAKEVTANLQGAYSKLEINAFCDILLNSLSASNKEEHRIIRKMVEKIGPQLKKTLPKPKIKRKLDSNQIKIQGF